MININNNYFIIWQGIELAQAHLHKYWVFVQGLNILDRTIRLSLLLQTVMHFFWGGGGQEVVPFGSPFKL